MRIYFLLLQSTLSFYEQFKYKAVVCVICFFTPCLGIIPLPARMFLLSASVRVRHDALQSTLMHFPLMRQLFCIVGKQVSMLSSDSDLS